MNLDNKQQLFRADGGDYHYSIPTGTRVEIVASDLPAILALKGINMEKENGDKYALVGLTDANLYKVQALFKKALQIYGANTYEGISKKNNQAHYRLYLKGRINGNIGYAANVAAALINLYDAIQQAHPVCNTEADKKAGGRWLWAGVPSDSAKKFYYKFPFDEAAYNKRLDDEAAAAAAKAENTAAQAEADVKAAEAEIKTAEAEIKTAEAELAVKKVKNKGMALTIVKWASIAIVAGFIVFICVKLAKKK